MAKHLIDADAGSTVASLSSGKVPTSQLGTGTANSSTFLRGDQTWASPSGGPGASATTVEVSLGSVAVSRGKFTITDAAISSTSKVLVWKAPGPYTGKGTRADEAEMDPINIVCVYPASGSCTVVWEHAQGLMYERFPLTGSGPGARSGAAVLAPPQDDPQARTFVQRRGKVRGNVKFTYMVLA